MDRLHRVCRRFWLRKKASSKARETEAKIAKIEERLIDLLNKGGGNVVQFRKASPFDC